MQAKLIFRHGRGVFRQRNGWISSNSSCGWQACTARGDQDIKDRFLGGDLYADVKGYAYMGCMEIRIQ